MSQRIRDIMTSNPRTIDADKSVAYAAKMMREEDVGVAPIVEGEKLIGLLTDRDISVWVAAQGETPIRSRFAMWRPLGSSPFIRSRISMKRCESWPSIKYAGFRLSRKTVDSSVLSRKQTLHGRATTERRASW